MKYNLIKISLLLLLILPFSCEFFDDDCGDFGTYYSTIDSMSIRIVDNFITPDSIQKRIFIEVINENYSNLNNDHFRFEISTANKAFACSPPEPTPSQRLESLNITCTDTIRIEDRVFVPNESLNSHFYVDGFEKVSIKKYLETPNNRLLQNSNPLVLGVFDNFEFNSELTFTLIFDDQAEFILKTNEL